MENTAEHQPRSCNELDSKPQPQRFFYAYFGDELAVERGCCHHYNDVQKEEISKVLRGYPKEFGVHNRPRGDKAKHS